MLARLQRIARRYGAARSSAEGELKALVGIVGLRRKTQRSDPFLDPSSDYKSNGTARKISKSVSEHSLVAERTGFVLMLKPNGKHVFRRLG